MRSSNATRSLITTLLSTVFLVFMLAGCDSAGSEENGSEGPSFDSGTLQSGDTYSYTFTEEANIPYYCENHEPDMTGQITVQAGAESTDPDTVIMNNLRFTPGNMTISPNTTVVWVNEEDQGVEPHTVTSGQPPSDGGGGY